MIDYKSLLVKYMNFVAEKDEWGSDNVCGTDYKYADDRFTKEEWDALSQCSAEGQK